MTPVVCMVTDRRRLPGDAEAALIRRIAAAARAGADLIQIRERDLGDRPLIALVARAVAAAHGTRARVLVNDRLDIAVAAGAHGVHLRADSPPASRIRAVAAHGFLIGRSVHSGSEAARAADEDGADYLLFGTVFDTSSKPDQTAAGLAGLRAAIAGAGPLPVLAIGGVSATTVPGLADTGCAGFAAIGLFADVAEDALPAALAHARAAWRSPAQ